jgi:hypothetical protein
MYVKGAYGEEIYVRYTLVGSSLRVYRAYISKARHTLEERIVIVLKVRSKGEANIA